MHLTIPLHVSALTLLVQSEKSKVLVIQRSQGQEYFYFWFSSYVNWKYINLILLTMLFLNCWTLLVLKSVSSVCQRADHKSHCNYFLNTWPVSYLIITWITWLIIRQPLGSQSDSEFKTKHNHMLVKLTDLLAQIKLAVNNISVLLEQITHMEWLENFWSFGKAHKTTQNKTRIFWPLEFHDNMVLKVEPSLKYCTVYRGYCDVWFCTNL